MRLQVAVDAPQHSGLTGALDYLSEHPLSPGTLVRVPLGRREVLGHRLVAGAPGERRRRAALRPLSARARRRCRRWTPRWRELVDFAAALLPARPRRAGAVGAAAGAAQARRRAAARTASRKLHKALAAAPPTAGAPTPRPRRAPSRRTRWPSWPRRRRRPPPVLLHGVTGSGKTEVYLRAAAARARRRPAGAGAGARDQPDAAARGALRRALRRAARIVSLHSGLTPAQRLRSWLAAHLGLADLVLGTRLAVFAPMPRLGLIVVDEEHDPSYKQQEGARYSARDLAVYRGRLEGAPVLLGSATPSLESWQRAERRAATCGSSLPARIGGGALPRGAPGRHEPAAQGPAAPARRCRRRWSRRCAQRIARGEQSLVFLNRRGYAPVLHCADCGWKSGCPHCSAWRVFHKLDRTLRCHHCGFTERVPRACPDCGNLDIAPIGRGTERLEEQLGRCSPPDGAAAHRPHRRRQHAAEGRARGAARRGARRRGRRAGRHADDHQGARLPPHHAGGGGEPRQRAVQQRLPRARAAVRAADAGRRPRRARRRVRAAARCGCRPGTRSIRSTRRCASTTSRPSRRASCKERETAGLPPFAHLALLRADARTAEAAQAFLQAAAELAAALPGAERGDASTRRCRCRWRAWRTSSACRCWSSRPRGRRCSASWRTGCRRCTSCGARPAAQGAALGHRRGPARHLSRPLSAADGPAAPARVAWAATGRDTSASSSVARTRSSTASARSAGGSSDSISSSSSSASSRSSASRWRYSSASGSRQRAARRVRISCGKNSIAVAKPATQA